MGNRFRAVIQKAGLRPTVFAWIGGAAPSACGLNPGIFPNPEKQGRVLFFSGFLNIPAGGLKSL